MGRSGRVPVVHRRTRRLHILLAALVAVVLPALLGLGPVRALALPTTNVIVQQWDGADPAPAATLAALGGTVTARLPVVGGFAATLPTALVGVLASVPGVRVVSPDALVLPDGAGDTKTTPSPGRS